MISVLVPNRFPNIEKTIDDWNERGYVPLSFEETFEIEEAPGDVYRLEIKLICQDRHGGVRIEIYPAVNTQRGYKKANGFDGYGGIYLNLEYSFSQSKGEPGKL